MIVNTVDDVLSEVQEFVQSEIRPFASDFDRSGKIPPDLIRDMASRGYLGANLPQGYGGLGLDPIQYGLFTESIGRACCSVRSILTVHSSLVGESILRFGTDDQKINLLPQIAKGEMLGAFALSEPDVGSDARSVKSEYKRRSDSTFVINGKKKWVTLGAIADIFLVIASNRETTTAFLVPAKTKGISVAPIGGLMANRASYIAELNFSNVEIPADNILGKEGSGFSYIANAALDSGRYSIAWGGLAIAQESLENMISYSRTRKQFGKPIHSFQLIQGIIGDCVTKVAAGRALCMRAGELRKQNHHDAAIETTIAKYYTSKIANETASDAVQIHGGNGMSDKYQVERLFREAKLLEIIEGTSQILQEVIASHGLSKFK